MSMGSPQSQQTASSVCFSKRRRSRATRRFQSQVKLRGSVSLVRGFGMWGYRFLLSPGHMPVVRRCRIAQYPWARLPRYLVRCMTQRV